MIAASFAVGLMAVVAVVCMARGHSGLYRVTILPSYGGKPFLPCAMNNRGQIAGLVWRIGGGFSVALWDRDHGLRDLEIATNDQDRPTINNAGQVAGVVTDSHGNEAVFLWDPSAGMVRLADGGMKDARICGFAGDARIVGSFQTDSGLPRVCAWDRKGGMQDLNPPDARVSLAHFINDSGLVLGVAGEGISGSPYLWDLADPNSIEWTSLPGQGAVYCDLNNAGYVLSQMVRPAEKSDQWPRKYAMLWHRSKEDTWLFPLPDLNAKVLHVNDANQVVYTGLRSTILTTWFPRYFPPREGVYLWDPIHGHVPLDRNLRLARTERLRVVDFNNGGCIVGLVWSVVSGQEHAVLLEPVAGRWER